MNIAICKWGVTPANETIHLFRLTNATGASIELTNVSILPTEREVIREM